MDLPKSEKEYRSTRCVFCDRAFKYSYTTVYPKDAVLIVRMSCPFCQKALEVNLNPYAKSKIYSYKSKSKPVQDLDIFVIDLPGELQAKERKE